MAVALARQNAGKIESAMKTNAFSKSKLLVGLIIVSALTLAGCSAATPEPLPTSTPTATLPPTATLEPTATVTPTEVPISSLPVDELVQKFMDGDIEDISSLSVEQQMRFTQAYAEALNQRRGANPVIYNNESYIDPISLDFLNINDGKSKQEQTIQMYLPAYKNAEGYLMVQTTDGQWIQIKGSKDVRYEVTNDPFDPNINWPDTEKVQADWLAEPDKGLAGLTIPQATLGSKAYSASMIPIVILDKELGEIKIGGFGTEGLLKALIIEKDSQGNPIAARTILITSDMSLYKTGLKAGSMGKLSESSAFWQKLEENTLYYFIYMTNQQKSFSLTYPQLGGEVTDNYTGLVSSNQTQQIITGENENHSLILIDGILLIKTDD